MIVRVDSILFFMNMQCNVGMWDRLKVNIEAF